MKGNEARFIASSPAVFDQILEYGRLGGYDLRFRERQLLVTDYFDTDRWDLLKAKSVVCLRRLGRTSMLGFTRLCRRDGTVQVLDESEETLSDVFPRNLDSLDCEIMGEVRRIARQRALLVVLTVENNRAIIDMVRNDEPRFQMVLDDVEFVGARDQRRHFELEIAPPGGDRYELEALLGVLASGFPLEPSPESKFERGLRLMRAWPVGVRW
jgi:inorganic triphosphatase YgiF